MSSTARSVSPARAASLARSHAGVVISAISSGDSSATGASSATGKAEHPLGDDVALDLRRPARDRPRERPQVLERPRPFTPRGRPGAPAVDRVGAERLGAHEVELALDLAREQLEQGVLHRLLTPGELGEAP